ncbi:methyl-accepting chemotaxis protein [Sphingorhabdus sp.]|jgi:methyl-accepting chemotaxis protein|uniref:methyl-accepting chemotaxis protein n=1 Tax=Sphingorhabdus sp. TaxID=1902408 RepID=UPI002FD90A47|nr:methyl-accepting chemotaxis protein [Sphingomonadaceae bacterium]
MKMEKVALSENHWIHETAQICGEVTVGCAEAAGVLEQALQSADWLKARHGEMTELTQALDADIAEVAQATRDARNLAEAAVAKLKTGHDTVQLSLASFSELISLIMSLGSHITGFAAAMEQVKRVSQSIDSIARTTNMLALNAAIEAEKAGAAGQTFAVVAAEVKKLTHDTRRAAVEITGTVNSLSHEAAKFVVEIEEGVSTSGAAQEQFSGLQELIYGVSDVVAKVGDHNREIADSTAQIHRGLVDSQNVRDAVEGANGEMFAAVVCAHSQIGGLEMQANKMFDHIVHSGLSKRDSEFVELARQKAEEVKALTEAAIADGTLTLEALFDTDLRPIEGSNPPRFTSKLTPWAEQHWQPFIEAVKDSNPDEITSVVCSSLKGFLPVQLKELSRPPTGDIAHDTKYCRNGRVIQDPLDIPAKTSEQDYMMAVFRHEGDGHSYKVMRNVYVPLRINGRRWGDFEIAYSV